MKLTRLGDQSQGVGALDCDVEIAVGGPDDGYAYLNSERHTGQVVEYFTGYGSGLFLHGDGKLDKGRCSRSVQPPGHKHAASFQLFGQNIASHRIRVLDSDVGKHKSLVLWDADIPDEDRVSVPVDHLKSAGKRRVDVPFSRIEERRRRVGIPYDEFRLLTGDMKLSRKPKDCRSRRDRSRPSAQCANPITQTAHVLLATPGWNPVGRKQNERNKAGKNAARKRQNSLRKFPSTPHGPSNSTAGGSL